jgi:hypothetical protein
MIALLLLGIHAPRGILRSILLNHRYHYWRQLGVHLPRAGARVPSRHGLSANELPEVLQGQEAGATDAVR